MGINGNVAIGDQHGWQYDSAEEDDENQITVVHHLIVKYIGNN